MYSPGLPKKLEDEYVFLTERLVSLATYGIALFLACYLMGAVARKQYRAILFIYLIALSAFAFFYQPYVTADLYRLREYMEWWIHKPWSDIFSYALRNSAPTWVLYSYILRQLDNINWLQTVTCLWCFGNVFYIVSHEIERNDIHGRNKGLMLFFVMAVGALFLQAISGIRTMLGISIVAFCFYRETIEEKPLVPHLILYLFAALLHSASMILVISRFVFLVIQYKETSKKLLMSLLVLLLGAFSVYYLRDYISGSFEYGQRYLLNKNEYTYFWEILIGLFETIQTVYVLRIFRRRFRYAEGIDGYNAIWKLCTIWTVISVIALPFSYSIFRRYTIFCTIIAIPLLGKLLENEQEINREKSNFIRLVWTLSLIIFAISGVRGDLCGYKFFVL